MQFGIPIFNFLSTVSDTALFRSLVNSKYQDLMGKFKQLYLMAADHNQELQALLKLIIKHSGENVDDSVTSGTKKPKKDGSQNNSKHFDEVSLIEREIIQRNKELVEVGKFEKGKLRRVKLDSQDSEIAGAGFKATPGARQEEMLNERLRKSLKDKQAQIEAEKQSKLQSELKSKQDRENEIKENMVGFIF